MCLFHWLRERGFNVTGITHVNHKLRGAESEDDERFVRAMAVAAGVKFYCRQAPVTQGNLEQEARRLRYSYWAAMIREGLADKIATGHTLDDQAETVLFRFLRGSGNQGLAGILPETREGIVRPLLHVSRAEVLEFLRSRGIAWREDTSNRDLKFARNRIRHGLLPQLQREWNPRIAETLAHTAEVARAEEEWWRGEIECIAADLLAEGEIRASKLAALPKAVSRRLVRRVAGKIGFEHVERVLELAGRRKGEGKLELPGLSVVRSFDWLRFSAGEEPASEPRPVAAPGKYRWGRGQICLEISETKSPGGVSPEDCARLKLCGRQTPVALELRGWRPGDHYRPAGRTRDEALAALFQRTRVPSWRRESWPIVTDGGQIVWSRRFGPAAERAAGTESGMALCIWEENNSGA